MTLSVATPPANRIAEQLIAKITLQVLMRLILTYLILVGFEVTFVTFYKYAIMPVYAYTDFRIVTGRGWELLLVILITPLPFLTAGTVIKSAGSLIVPVLVIFLFIPTPLFLFQNSNPIEFWQAYAALWTASLIVCVSTNLSPGIVLSKKTPAAFGKTITIYAVIMGALLLYSTRSGLHIVSFADIYQVRAELEIGRIAGYTVGAYIYSFGGLFLAIALLRKRYLLVALTIVGFIICYGILSVKAALLAPAWVMYLYLGVRYFAKDKLYRFYLVLMLPFIVVAIAYYFIRSLDVPLLLFGLSVINYRLYTIPATAFVYYLDFFSNHPYTYWSQITGISWIVHYPFSAPLSVMFSNVFGRGNQNASFLLTEGLASGGLLALPFAAALMGIVIAVFNAAGRGHSRSFLALALTMPANQFIDRPLMTCILSGGLLFFLYLLAIMPAEYPEAKSVPT